MMIVAPAAREQYSTYVAFVHNKHQFHQNYHPAKTKSITRLRSGCAVRTSPMLPLTELRRTAITTARESWCLEIQL